LAYISGKLNSKKVVKINIKHAMQVAGKKQQKRLLTPMYRLTKKERSKTYLVEAWSQNLIV
jgi:hypothetical protein